MRYSGLSTKGYFFHFKTVRLVEKKMKLLRSGWASRQSKLINIGIKRKAHKRKIYNWCLVPDTA